jgi:hypothetical protein
MSTALKPAPARREQPAPAAPAPAAAPPGLPQTGVYWGDKLGLEIWLSGAAVLVVLHVLSFIPYLFR